MPCRSCGKAAADHHVDDLVARQLGHLLQRRVDRERGEVVGAGVDERPLRARPIGVRAAATITASDKGGLSCEVLGR